MLSRAREVRRRVDVGPRHANSSFSLFPLTRTLYTPSRDSLSFTETVSPYSHTLVTPSLSLQVMSSGGKSSGDSGKAKAQSRSARAGLQFPVGRIHRLLRRGHYAKRIGAGAPGESSCASLHSAAGDPQPVLLPPHAELTLTPGFA